MSFQSLFDVDQGTEALMQLIENTPEYYGSDRNLIQGVYGLGVYSRYFRSLKAELLERENPPSTAIPDDDDSESGEEENLWKFTVDWVIDQLKDFLDFYWDEEGRQEMREVYDIVATRIEDSDNTIYGSSGSLSGEQQQNMIDTIISGMNFLPGDFETWETVGPALEYYELAGCDTDNDFFAVPLARVSDGVQCRRVEISEAPEDPELLEIDEDLG